MSSFNDFAKLVDVLDSVARLVDGKPAEPDNELNWAMHGTLLKFYLHCMSIRYIANGTKISEVGFDHIDGASINVLIRAAIETFIVFHYNFIASVDEEERICRYLGWCLKDLHSRQKFAPISKISEIALMKEKGEIKEYQDRLRRNGHFRFFGEKQQQAMIERGQWPLWNLHGPNRGNSPSWIDLGVATGIHEDHMRDIYSFLCGYAHASYWSVRQLNSINSSQTELIVCEGDISFLSIVTAFMLKCCIDKWGLGLKLPGLAEIMWRIGSTSREELDNDLNC